MVHSAPLDSLELVATSAAEDAGFVALCDIATLLSRREFAKALVIGGHMVSLHARRWGLNLFRETQDADLGVPQLALNAVDIAPAMEALGYARVRSNRFSKQIPDAPEVEAVVDILVPALTSHPRKNVAVGGVTTIEVPGLAEALNRPPSVLTLQLTRRNGDVLGASIKIPDERSALILKTMAWETRAQGRDAVDVWRCLEIARAASLTSRDFQSDDSARTMAILKRAFGSAASDGVAALSKTQRLSTDEKAARSTRIRALIERLRTT